ncbi:MAG: hypothetical protein ACREPR_14985 [Brasilonema sp.]
MTYEIRFRTGEIYGDMLTVDAFQRGESIHGQADSLLGAKLMERESMIVKRNQYLAWKRGISPARMWLDIIEGKAKPLTKEELTELRAQGLLEEGGDVPGLRDSK